MQSNLLNLGENHSGANSLDGTGCLVVGTQALRQTEKKLNDTQMEVEVLRKGVQARDEALHFMKDEVDRSVDILSHAAETREVFMCL